jgi:hypothetical protein
MSDILTRLAALIPEHPVIAELREHIRRGYGFGASTDHRRWILSDEEINAVNTGFRVLDDSRRDLIALVREAAAEIERLRIALIDAKTVLADYSGRTERSDEIWGGIKEGVLPIGHASRCYLRVEQALNPQEPT